jgi:hypothetical protein
MYFEALKFMGSPLPRDTNPLQSQHKGTSMGILLLP